MFTEVRENPQRMYIFLTKNPKRYLETRSWPENCWAGATVEDDTKWRERYPSLRKLTKRKRRPKVIFASFEPLMGPIQFDSHKGPVGLDWIIVGKRSKSSGMEAGQPEWGWVMEIYRSAETERIPLYFKPNLTVRPKQYPK